MAVYYCDPSLLTGANDGTSLSDAWQDLVAVLSGTGIAAGLAAGDVVYIRTHDGTSDISVSITSGITWKAGTAAAPITFIFDDGTVWPNGGTLTIDGGTSNHYHYIEDYIAIKAAYDNDAGTYGLRLKVGYESNIQPWIRMGHSTVEGVHFYKTSSATRIACIDSKADYTACHFIGCNFENSVNYSSYGIFRCNRRSASYRMDSCVFDMTHTPNTGGNTGVIFLEEYANRIEINGGRITNGATGQLFIHERNITQFHTYHSSRVEVKDIDTNGLNIEMCGSSPMVGSGMIEAVDTDYNYWRTDEGGLATWRAGKNYPTLNAVLPDATPWSVRCFPNTLSCSVGSPAVINKIRKLYTQTSAILTLTVEMAIKDTSAASGAFDNINTSNVWARFTYTDNTTGISKTIETPRDGTALSSSDESVTWVPEIGSRPVYGGNNYDKYTLAITTPTAVKQNTAITCEVFFGLPAIDPDDFFFVDPEVSIS